MRANYPIMQDWIGLSEGGYVDHPRDPGGATDRGITQRTYDGYRVANGLSKKSVRGIPKHVAEEIIEKYYFDRAGADVLPSGLDYTVADYAVNSGVSQAVRDLQRALGVTADGVFGPVTQAAATEALKDGRIDQIIVDVNERRFKLMRSLRHWSTFKDGWTTRVWGHREGVQDDDIGVADRSVRMLRTNVHKIPPPHRPKDATIKARPEDSGRLSIWEIITRIVHLIVRGKDA